MPCVVAGSLAAGNRQAIDWGWQGFTAYGCQSLVVVWHTSTMERVNTLDGHRQHVVKVNSTEFFVGNQEKLGVV